MIIPRDYQEPAIAKLVETNRAIIKSPAGSGKTIIGAEALNRWAPPRARLGRRKMRVAWIANTEDQVAQARAAVALCPNLSQYVDLIFACYAAGLNLAACDLVILDECHHIAAPEYRKGLDLHRGWRWGLSATPEREDELAKDVYHLIGPIIHTVPREALVAAGQLAKGRVHIHRVNAFGEAESDAQEMAESLFKKWRFSAQNKARELTVLPVRAAIIYKSKESADRMLSFCQDAGVESKTPVGTLMQKYPTGSERRKEIWQLCVRMAEEEVMDRAKYQACLEYGIYSNGPRTNKTISLARDHAADSTMIIIGKIEYGELLATNIPNSVLVFSKMGKKKRTQAIADFAAGNLRCMIATSLADEGLDVPRANVLILAAAGRSSAKAEQRTGRVLRTFHDKTHGTIHDFMDVQHHFLLAQSKRRISLYHKLGYEVITPNREVFR